MRILLALITVFAVFQAQAYCYITGNSHQPEVTSDTITLDLDAGSATKEYFINLSDSSPDFKCLSGGWTPNTFNLSTKVNTDYYYKISNSMHNLAIKISLKAGTPTKSAAFTGNTLQPTPHKAVELNTFKYVLTYSVLTNYTGSITDTIETNTAFGLNNFMIIKPVPCDMLSCLAGNNNNAHEYRNRIRLLAKFTPTTCTFKNQEITAPSISYHEISSNSFVAPATKQPEIECSSITGVATSNIHYHFEAISMAQGNILKNDLEAQLGSAGEVGFQLMNNNKAINFLASEKFTLSSRGSALQDNTIYPLNLQLRYARYGNKVFAGKVQSKVKVVVDYD
ncbi:hypothetical protein [Pseudescherichia sp.]|uniref:hypothetical protein n=1 Tax=Pseudescherichia sp. TaxID=2055881 RepID=UPI002897C9EC|nr:hypothetical protein [Pseudescherichia sp.]